MYTKKDRIKTKMKLITIVNSEIWLVLKVKINFTLN